MTAALDLFAKKGFSPVSVRDIAAEVGVRESALYRHFHNKQAIFDQLISDYLKVSDNFMTGINALPTDNPGEINKTVELYAQLTDEDFLATGNRVFTDFLMKDEVLKF